MNAPTATPRLRIISATGILTSTPGIGSINKRN
jgi:hypothetical protein